MRIQLAKGLSWPADRMSRRRRRVVARVQTCLGKSSQGSESQALTAGTMGKAAGCHKC